MGCYTAMCRHYCCTLQCSKSVCLGLFSWTWMDDNIPEKYLRLHPTRDSRSDTLCLVREKLLPGIPFLDAMITCDRSTARGRERLSCRKRQVLYSIIFGPAGRRHDSKGPPAGSCKFEKGESAGQIRGFDPRISQKQPAGHGGLTRE